MPIKIMLKEKLINIGTMIVNMGRFKVKGLDTNLNPSLNDSSPEQIEQSDEKTNSKELVLLYMKTKD